MTDLKGLVPTYDELFNPTLDALRDLGGSGSNHEIFERVTELLDLPEEVIQVSHLGSTTQTELEYRLAWSRTYLKKAGYVNNSQRGVWALTPKGRSSLQVDPEEVKAYVRNLENGDGDRSGAPTHAEHQSEAPSWQEVLLGVLQKLEPDAFERLCQRLLREAGFVEVQVTGRSGDGGIDGRGVVRLAGMLTFPIIFQCKRYTGSVGPEVVRDFRGAMMGRADRGLILTTGRFTRGAEEEATRDGVPPVDLIDGNGFCEKLAEFEMGVLPARTYSIDREWFEAV